MHTHVEVYVCYCLTERVSIAVSLAILQHKWSSYYASTCVSTQQLGVVGAKQAISEGKSGLVETRVTRPAATALM